MPDFFSPVMVNERVYFILLNSDAVGVSVVDENGNYIYANNEYCDILDYSEAELYRKRFQDVTHPEDIGWDTEEAAKVAKGLKKGYGPVSKRYVTKSGGVVPVKIRVDGIRSESGEFLYFIGQAVRVAPKHCDSGVDKNPPTGNKWLEFLKENWLVVVLMVSTLAATVNNIFAEREDQQFKVQASQEIQRLENVIEQITVEKAAK
jgi:PAS domain S-box-containing protein